MKVLVTGGAGFIGSHIVDALIENGMEAVILDNLSTGRRENINPKAAFYHADIRDKALSAIFLKEKPDVVCHHAAQVSVRNSVADPCTDADINITGAINLMEACRISGVKKVVFASSGGAIRSASIEAQLLLPCFNSGYDDARELIGSSQCTTYRHIVSLFRVNRPCQAVSSKCKVRV